MTLKASLYNDYDNVPVVELSDNGVVSDLSGATNIEVTVGGVTYSSATNPEYFDLINLATGLIGLKFADIGIAEGTYNVRVAVFDVINTDGFVWVHEDDDVPIVLVVVE